MKSKWKVIIKSSRKSKVY